MASKVLGCVLLAAVLCTACGEREKRMEKEMAAPPAGCCQQANTCESPLTEAECGQLNGTFTEGGACQSNGQCGPQPQ